MANTNRKPANKKTLLNISNTHSFDRPKDRGSANDLAAKVDDHGIDSPSDCRTAREKSGVGSAAYACPGARLLTSTRAELAMKVIGHKPQ